MVSGILSLLISLTLTAVADAQAQHSDYVPFNASQSTPRTGRQSWLNIESSKPSFTNEVNFDRWNTTQASSNWRWKISTYDVENPNITVYDLPDSEMNRNVSNSSVAFTTYSFSWPEDGTLNSATRAESSTRESCFYFIDVTFPQNVSNAWDGSSASCTSALGDSCVQAIMNGFSGNGCDSGNFPFQVSFDACAGSLGAAENGPIINAYPFGNASAPSNSSSFESGDVYAWLLSDLHKPGNSTALNESADQLRMIVLTDSTTQNTLRKHVLCNRAGPGNFMKSDESGTNAAGSSFHARLAPSVALAVAAMIGVTLSGLVQI